MKRLERRLGKEPVDVAPRAGAWIETIALCQLDQDIPVAPRAGAWIETAFQVPTPAPPVVAPRAGAWIETSSGKLMSVVTIVAPRAGAWIEAEGLLDSCSRSPQAMCCATGDGGVSRLIARANDGSCNEQ